MMYNAERIILLVRNPYDAIDSYWNMCCTNTHTESVVEEVYDLYRDKFRGLALSEMGTWVRFIKYWLINSNTTFREREAAGGSDGGGGGNRSTRSGGNGNSSGNGPSVLLVRFEDLIQKTETVMEEVMRFITVDDAATTNGGELHPFWKWRIRRGLGLDDLQNTTNSNTPVNTSSLGSYKPRSDDGAATQEKGRSTTTSSIGKSLGKKRYTDDDLERMHQIAQDEALHHPTAGRVNILQLLGYDILNDKFPSNFEQDEDEEERQWELIYQKEKGKDSVSRINLGPELRPTDSEFGRAMTRWRRSQTFDDTQPFETTTKKIV